MLKESFLSGNPGENVRRWFSDDYFDLIVWIAEDGSLSGFQLCYDKYKKERALTWTREKGFSHERVEDGESNPSKNLTPILIPDGACPAQDIIRLFLQRSGEVDPQTKSLIAGKLQEYSDLSGIAG